MRLAALLSLYAEAVKRSPATAGMPVMLPVHCVPFGALVNVAEMGVIGPGVPPVIATSTRAMLETFRAADETDSLACPVPGALGVLLQPTPNAAVTTATASARLLSLDVRIIFVFSN
ncbi:MAG TPA: hypothetical protein VIM19_13910 [Actinomycetes bacterium]